MDESKQVKQSRKDKRKQKLQKQMEEQIAELTLNSENLDSTFTVSTMTTTAASVVENAIKAPSFSISAAGKELIVNAELNLTLGRRYGLVGEHQVCVWLESPRIAASHPTVQPNRVSNNNPFFFDQDQMDTVKPRC